MRACALSLAVLQAWRSGTGDGGGAGFLEYPIRSQNDASEFLGKVVDALQEELKGTSHAEGLALALGCKSSVVKLCRRCGAKTVGREEISTITPVSIQDMERRYETLEQALARPERGPSPSPLSLWLAWARVLPPGCPPGYCLPGTLRSPLGVSGLCQLPLSNATPRCIYIHRGRSRGRPWATVGGNGNPRGPRKRKGFASALRLPTNQVYW